MTAERKLSSLEKFFYNRSRSNLHSCFYVGIQLNKLPEKSQIEQALKETITTYAQLHQNIAIDPTDNQPYIKNIESALKFDDVAEYTPDNYTEDTINQIFQTRNFPYHVEQPLWRLLIFENERKFLLLLDHTLFDGMSAVAFWKTFMNCLPDQIVDPIENIWEPTLESGSQEDSHPYDKWPTTWSSMLIAPILGLLFKLRPSAITALPKDQLRFHEYGFPDGLFAQTESNEPVRHNIRNDNCQQTVKVKPNDLKDLLSACKNHGVSLTSFLAALLANSMHKCLEKDSYTGSYLKIDVPMNTRRACAKMLNIPDSSMTMGNFVASTELKYDLQTNDDFWEVAQRFCQSLKHQTTTNVSAAINNVRLLDAVDSTKFLEEKVKAVGPSGTFEVTNLGAQEFGKVNSNDHFVVEDAVFNEPQGISDVFTCSTITTPMGGLYCSLSYPRDIRKSIEPCLAHFKQFLDSKDYN